MNKQNWKNRNLFCIAALMVAVGMSPSAGFSEDWIGAYVAGAFGVTLGQTDWNRHTSGLLTDSDTGDGSASFGAAVGYDWRLSSNFIGGFRAGYQSSLGSSEDTLCGNVTLSNHTCSSEISDAFTLGGRLGRELSEGTLAVFEGGYVTGNSELARTSALTGTSVLGEGRLHGGYVGFGFLHKVGENGRLGINFRHHEFLPGSAPVVTDATRVNKITDARGSTISLSYEFVLK